MLTILLGLASVAGTGAAAYVWTATGPRRERRRVHRARVRDWQRELAALDSRAVDAMPRTGGPPDTADRP